MAKRTERRRRRAQPTGAVSSQPRRDRDRGTTTVLVVASMVLLFGFAAFAVDLADAWSQRRQNQGTVDTGTVAGALMTRSLDQAGAIAAAETEIIRITYSSLSPSMTLAAWTAEWAACTDPTKPAAFSITGLYDCISFSNSLVRVRSYLPDQPTNTAFARVIGVDTLTTDAFAEVGTFLGGNGAILPFGLPGTAATQSQVCLKTGPDPQSILPCQGPDTGNFRFLDLSEYGNELFNSTTLCVGDENGRLARNIARGIDHPLVTAPGAGAAFRTDLSGCLSGNINYLPYSLTTDTGDRAAVLDDGFINGEPGIPGRLTRSTNTVTYGGKTFDNTSLFAWLNSAGKTLCGSSGTMAEMILCLDNWDPVVNGTIFVDDLAGAARFAWVPMFFADDLGNGNTTHNIQAFLPVYIQTTLWKCTPNACSAIHNPAEPLVGTIASNDRLFAVTAIRIPDGALPDSISSDVFNSTGGATYAISR